MADVLPPDAQVRLIRPWGDCQPGFRVTADQLSNNEAWDAVQAAARRVTDAALAARLDLLNLGFSAEHSVCEELDETAREYALLHGAIASQRKRAEPQEDDRGN